MSYVHAAAPPTAAATRQAAERIIKRWMVSFVGYPLGGFAALWLVGRVNSPGRALAGGLLTGVVLGAVQVWSMGPARPRTGAWILATAVGLMVGLTIGAALVGYQTDLRSLVVQGAVSGAVVGLVQAVVLMPMLGAVALGWPLLLSGAMAIGWAVTTSAGVGVDHQFAIFGSLGAIVATLLTSGLPLLLNTRPDQMEGTS